jgi:hypothetical protein
MLNYPSERKLNVLGHAFSERDQRPIDAHLTSVDRTSRDIFISLRLTF